MAAPKVVSVAPADGAIGVSLGTKITVTFDQVVDSSTLSTETFLLTGPGMSSLVTSYQVQTPCVDFRQLRKPLPPDGGGGG